MHGFRKSDGTIVVKKPANNRERAAYADRERAEPVERRVPAKGNYVMAGPVGTPSPNKQGKSGLTECERLQGGRVVTVGGWSW